MAAVVTASTAGAVVTASTAGVGGDVITASTAGAIATVTLSKEPVNSMSLEFWEAFLHVVTPLDANPAIRCIIFQSGLKRDVFTAGLDINELFAPKTSEERLRRFWTALSKALLLVYGSSKVTIAAVAGACPAGGCALALCCDYRVITANGSMGLNEVALGIPVPMFWVELMASRVGRPQTEAMLLGAAMPGAPTLKAIGMVDHVVKTRGELHAHAVTVAKKYLRFPPHGFVATKEFLHRDLHSQWAAGIGEEATQVWDSISSEATVASLTMVLKRLGGKKPKKAKL